MANSNNNNNTDQQLATTLHQLEVSPEQNHQPQQQQLLAMEIPNDTIMEENPFYEPYPNTDMQLWQKLSDYMDEKKLSPKQRMLVRKPILQHLQNQSKVVDNDWLQCNLQEVESEFTWVKVKARPEVASGSGLGSPVVYNMNDLIMECEKLQWAAPEEELNANDLITYFDSLIYIPKSMSVMAETMYS